MALLQSAHEYGGWPCNLAVKSVSGLLELGQPLFILDGRRRWARQGCHHAAHGLGPPQRAILSGSQTS